MGQYFKGGPIRFEGPKTDNLNSFRHYDKERMIGDKPMKDHLRFAMSYWHTMRGGGADPFGAPTQMRPWERDIEPMEMARVRADVAFEFMQKMGLDYYCFHDVDIAPEGKSLREKLDNVDRIADVLEAKMEETGIKLLWGTTNAFSHPRFAHGAASSCDADVLAFAAAQVQKAIETTHRLGGENYVFWGGREGYETLLNTDMKLELDNLGRFFHAAVDYKEKIGFKGQFLIEPKPKEPTKHQYDFDTATVLSFLQKYDLLDHFKVNIEVNHATLAGHTFEHEMRTARINGILGSIDINQGDPQLGWDTDQFPSDIYPAVLGMIEVLRNGGIAPGGLNFDAKLRRGSLAVDDMVYAYILGMDTYAKALEVAHRIVSDGAFERIREERYASYRSGIGLDFVQGRADFDALKRHALAHDRIELASGAQEKLEMILNRYLFN